MIRLFAFFLVVFFSITAEAQDITVTLSGIVKDKATKSSLPYVNLVLKTEKDSKFIAGTVTNEDGRFTINNIKPGDYFLEITYMGYTPKNQTVLVGRLSEFLDLATIDLEADIKTLNEIVVTAKQDAVAGTMDKKTFKVDDNISQGGGSVLQSMKNLPGITVDQQGKVQLRGSDKVTVLIDGKQTALTGFGNQTGLDNIPASAIEKIEIINNPSSKYDANGMAGIINIVYKKNKQEGLNGKLGVTTGIGGLAQKRENLPTIRPQYQSTPKINPSISLNYRKNKINVFFQGDVLGQKILNKNEFTERIYDTGEKIHQQYQENRTQLATTMKGGVDWFLNENNSFTFSALYNREGHIDRGDLPYFNSSLTERQRLWMFYEDEVNTAINTSASFQHKFKQPGHLLNAGFNFTFHREDEKYFITNMMPSITGNDSFKLIADQHVNDFNVDYIKPLKHGRIETGVKFRWRHIPTNMKFYPGENSPMDLDAAGWANYNEFIPALYGNYIFESKHLELEAGLRLEYVNLDYRVDPNHNTYKSDGYKYIQPFPNLRLAYPINNSNTVSFFYNRRVDRPDEGDIRIFPKYDDPEVLKVGNPALRPQFTQTFELGYKTNWGKGYLYSALYHRRINDMITRIATVTQGSNNIYSIMQNAGDGFNTGSELVLNQEVTSWFTFNINLNAYQNNISAFSVENEYPVIVTYNMTRTQNYSGNTKLNGIFRLPRSLDIQLTGVYLAPDIIPQGKIDSRYSVDLGLKKGIKNNKGELFINASDLFNTLRIKKDILSNGVKLNSTDVYETQVIRAGYNYKF